MPHPKPSERRFFLCTGQCVAYKDLHKYADSHILGELRYLTYESRRVTTLAIYETPVSAGTVPPIKPVIVDYSLVSPKIDCRYPHCTNSQRWELGRSGFLALMDRMGYQDKLMALEEQEMTANNESVA